MPSWSAKIILYLLFGSFCAAGPVLLFIATFTGIERAFFIHSSSSADGVVVALRRVPNSAKKSMAPTFRFNAQDGTTFTVNSDIYENSLKWRLGGHVRVFYQREHPENACIDSFWQLWMPQFVTGIVGGGFSIVPLLIFVGRRRAAARS